jgi:hypothetical protein
MMSHMDPDKGTASPPCFKSKHGPGEDVILMLGNIILLLYIL